MNRGATCLLTASGSMCNPGGYTGVIMPFVVVQKGNPGGKGFVFRGAIFAGGEYTRGGYRGTVC